MELLELEILVKSIPESFRETIQYFRERTGSEISWPSPSPIKGLPHVVTQAKAIYKPSRSFNEEDVALTIRQILNSPYKDLDPLYREDGTWVYAYHQEGKQFSDSYTNDALLRNKHKKCPVVVLIQTKLKPNPIYRVEGIAVVVDYADNFFYLEGFNSDGWARTSASDAVLDSFRSGNLWTFQTPTSGSNDLEFDARVRAMASIVVRQGQSKFRNDLLSNYNSTCVISGIQISEVLDAAHILPYRGEHTNSLNNGIVLRSDLHNLFDVGLIAIDPESRRVIVSPKLCNSQYWEFSGRRILEPVEANSRPSTEILEAHLRWCGERIRN